MPLVRIDAPAADDPTLTALGDAVHEALTTTLDVPPDDLFQVLRGASTGGRVRYDPNYLGIARDDDVVIVEITLRHGRTDDQKRAFYATFAARVAATTAVEPRNLVVTLVENTLADWSFGNGEPQYLDRVRPG
jgi:hypothetical protein